MPDARWSTTRAARSSAPRSTKAASSPRFPSTPTRTTSALRSWSCAWTPPRSTCHRSAAAGHRMVCWPTRRSARTRPARSRSTARRSAPPRRLAARRSSARATTRPSTCWTAAASSSAPPAGRCRSCRSASTRAVCCAPPGRCRAPSAHRGGGTARERARTALARARPRHVHRRTPRRGARPSLPDALRLPRPLELPARGDRALLLPGARRQRHLPGAVLRPEHQRDRLPRRLSGAAGSDGLLGLRLDAAHLLRRLGRSARAPGPPLGGARLRRRDHAAPAAHRLHRCVPKAARHQLLHRRDAARTRDPRGLRRLLAARRPAVGHGPGDRLGGGDVAAADRRPVRHGAVGWARSRRRHVRVAPVHRARLLDPGAARRPDHRAPGDHHAPAPLAVPRPGTARGECRRHADVAGLRAALARPASQPSRPCSC